MIRLILVVILVAIIVTLIYTKHSYFTKKRKLIIGIIYMIILSSAIVYEFSFGNEEQKNIDKIIAFNQGETLICGTYEVSKNEFRYNGGTMVFLSNRDELKAISLPISECNMKKSFKE